jgi:hypothetical protein
MLEFKEGFVSATTVRQSIKPSLSTISSTAAEWAASFDCVGIAAPPHLSTEFWQSLLHEARFSDFEHEAFWLSIDLWK